MYRSGSGEADWLRCLLGELAPDRLGDGDNERASEGDTSMGPDLRPPGDMLEGREPPDPLLYDSDLERRREPTDFCVSKGSLESEIVETHLALVKSMHQNFRASEAQRDCLALDSAHCRF